MARFYNPSPSFPFLAGLFGQNVEYNKKGAYKLTPNMAPGSTGGLFGQAAQGDIGGYLNLTGDNAYTQSLGRIGNTGSFNSLPAELRDPYFQATGALDQFIGTARPVVDTMIETGNPTDISSLTAAAQSRYANQFIPEAAERYNPASGTGFANIAAREANLMAAELGQLDFAAQEAAKQRQLQGVTTAAPALASLASARLALPGATLQELQGLSQTSDPGGRLLAALQALLGSSEQQTDLLRSQPASGGGGGGDMLSSILGPVGSLLGCWVAEELFGPNDPRTAHARLWCTMNPDHPFVRRYMREGPEWAAWLADNPWARPIVEPTWLAMAYEGARIARLMN